MTIWFDADGANGRVGIYTGDDDLPMAAPASYLGRTKFHTDFAYLPFVPAKRFTGTVTVVSPLTDTLYGSLRRTLTLAAHGMGGIPFVYGFVTVGGIIRPLCGTVPVWMSSSGTGSVIHFTLGVDSTNVFISEGRSIYAGAGSNFDVDLDIYVSDKLV